MTGRPMTPGRLYAGTEASTRAQVRLSSPVWLAVLAAVALSVLGSVSIATTEPALASRQAIFLCVGLACAALVALVPARALQMASWFVLAIAVALLVFVLLPFVPKWLVTPRNGARAWIDLGVADFQPSELAKIAFIISVSQWLAIRGSPRTIRALLVPAAVLLALVALIVLEPDLGSALLFAPTLFAILAAAGARWRHLLVVVLIAVSAAPIGYFALLKPYQRARIDAIAAQIRGDTRFERDIGFQGWRAMRLVGAGGIAGNDVAHARALIVHNKLPEEHNDMIFAVVACRFGFSGAIATLLGYALYLLAAMAVAISARDGFSKLVAVGIGALIFSQMVVNIGMTIGLLPITGVTLPFVSYGGSSLVMTWVMTGLLVGLGIRPPRGGEKDPFDA